MNLRHMLLMLTVIAASGLAALAAETPTPVVVTSNTPPAQATNEIKLLSPDDKLYTNSVEMELIRVPGGFWAGKYDVTQKEFQKVMGFNPSAFGGGNRPVDSVSWQDAMDFCAKMTKMDLEKELIPKGYHYTLPTEEEWESLVGNAGLAAAVTSLDGTSRSATSPVGSLAPNELGLYDMRGNVSQFVLSDDSKAYRILRGGSWQDFTEINLRPEFRWYCKPDERRNTFGFRCLLKAGGK